MLFKTKLSARAGVGFMESIPCWFSFYAALPPSYKSCTFLSRFSTAFNLSSTRLLERGSGFAACLARELSGSTGCLAASSPMTFLTWVNDPTSFLSVLRTLVWSFTGLGSTYFWRSADYLILIPVVVSIWGSKWCPAGEEGFIFFVAGLATTLSYNLALALAFSFISFAALIIEEIMSFFWERFFLED